MSTPNRCARCGRENDPKFAFCLDCGQPLAAPEKPPADAGTCPSCGAPCQPGFRFCGLCGKPLGQTLGPAARQGATGPVAVAAAPLPAVPRAARIRLALVRNDGVPGPILSVEKDEALCGRTEGDLLLPEDPTVSPRHARFTVAGGVLRVEDLGSVNLANVCGMYAIGVFCDRPDITAEASSYYRTGRGNGTHDHSVYYLHPGYLGQWQESHRDQGHSTLGIALAGMLCEMAWNQGEDLYGLWNNRLLAGAEYVAKTNALAAPAPDYTPYPMPFTPYDGVQGPGTAVAGVFNPRPCWELIYHHYVGRKGLSAPWSQAMAEPTIILSFP